MIFEHFILRRLVVLSFFATLTVLIILAPRILLAGEAKMGDVVVTNSAQHLLLYATVKNAFDSRVEKAVQNGIAATFTFYVELVRHRVGWVDQEIVALRVTRSMVFDNLKDEYRIVFQEEGKRTVTTKSLAEAKRLMADLNGVRVAPLSSLEPEAEYSLRVRTRFDEKKMILNFHYIIPFWKPWGFETEWYTVSFRY